MTWLALAVALVALIAALLARAKAGSQAALVEDAARDARRRLEALKEELSARQDNLRQMVAELAAGAELTRQQVLDGMLWSEVGPDEGRALVAAGGVRVLDVRTPAETAGGVFPGAVLIPIEELERRFRELPSSGQRTLICCAGGARSAAACEFLSGKGYSNLMNLTGGMSSWAGPVARPGAPAK
jgi:rhodanese-related sulfurtransferase